MTTTVQTQFIGSGNLNLNDFRINFNFGAPAYNPAIEYLSIDWNFNLIYKFNIGTVNRGDKVRTMILKPQEDATALNNTTAILAMPVTNYQGDPQFFIGGGTNLLRVLYDNVEPIYSIDLDVEPVAVEMKAQGHTSVYAALTFPVLIIGFTLAAGQNMEVEGYLTCAYTVLPL